MITTSKQDPRDLEQIKKDIDLVHFLEQEGFQINKKKTCSTYIALDFIKDGVKVEKLVVSRTGKYPHDMYFNRDDFQDKGSVIAYLQKKHGKDNWKEIYENIDRYMGNVPQDYLLQAKQRLVSKEEGIEHREVFIKRDFGLKPLTDKSYIHFRGITEETLNAPEFKDRIFNIIKEQGENRHVNTAFPIKNQHGTTNVIIKNRTFGGFLKGEKQGGVWITQTKHKDGQTDKVIIFESPIDALSYHQMNPPKSNEKVVYIATGGTMDEAQSRFIQKAVDVLNAKQIIIANDSDLDGHKHTIKQVGMLQHSNSPESANVYARLEKSTYTAQLVVHISHQDNPSEKEKAVLFAEDLTKDLNRLTAKGEEPTAKMYIAKKGLNQTEIEINFTSGRAEYMKVERALIKLKGLEEVIQIHYPIEKDFNEDLKVAIQKQAQKPIQTTQINEKVESNKKVIGMRR